MLHTVELVLLLLLMADLTLIAAVHRLRTIRRAYECPKIGELYS